MNYTNRYNIPEHICKWLANDEYDHDPSVISATTLISPARAWALKRQHVEELTMDYSDMISIRQGTAMHDSLEKAATYGENIIEQRFYSQIMGFTISGKMDAVIDGVIRDNKTTSVWKITKGDFNDYIKQLSIYKWLLHKNGIETADYAFIDFFFTDWKKSDAAKGGNYPPIKYQEQRLELWSVEKTEEFILERLNEFVFAELSLPRCTEEELWQTDTKYAYYAKEGLMKASRIFDSSEEAHAFAAKNGGVVQTRLGKAKRCNYCTAAPFCDQFNELKAAGLIDE